MRHGKVLVRLAAGGSATLIAVAGCAATTGTTTASDYTKNQALNSQAQLVGDPLQAKIQDDPTFGGIRIVPTGIEVDVVSGGSAAVRSAIAAAGTRVPIHTRAVTHGWPALQALTDRLNKDQPKWRARGVLLSMWGPDVTSNRVEISLSKYDAAAAAALTAAYGAAWVVVSRVPVSISAS